MYMTVLGQRKLVYLYKVHTIQHSYSVMHTVVDYNIAKGYYLFPCTAFKGAYHYYHFHLAHGKKRAYHILCQYLYRHIHTKYMHLYILIFKGFIPKQAIPLRKQHLSRLNTFLLKKY